MSESLKQSLAHEKGHGAHERHHSKHPDIRVLRRVSARRVPPVDAILAEDLLLNSPAGFGIRGLKTFKDFAAQFTNLGYRIDLVDEHLALDAEGNGRGFITFCLHWKHMKDFGGLSPTGREGTSVEAALFTIREKKIVRIDVADNSLDLVIYMWERDWPIPHNIRPEPIAVGVDRRPAGKR
jgi:hypothetical protein